jgi:hypothetical protein
MALNVISQLASVATKLNIITKICKYRGFHEGHHFILMAMEVHLGVIWVISSRNVPIFFTINNQKVNYIYLFAFFLRQYVNIVFQHALASTVERKIVLAGDVCSTPPIIISSHDLHVGDIRRVVGQIASYHKRD